MKAVVNTARIKAGNSVVVIGAGGVGQNSIQGAALADAQPVIAIDLLDNKLTAARVELYKNGRLQLDELITACYSLRRINEAIAAVRRGEALRNVILF